MHAAAAAIGRGGRERVQGLAMWVPLHHCSEPCDCLQLPEKDWAQRGTDRPRGAADAELTRGWLRGDGKPSLKGLRTPMTKGSQRQPAQGYHAGTP